MQDRPPPDGVRFASRSTRSNRNGTFSRHYRGEVELFLVHCQELDRIYAVPVDQAPTCQMLLRVAPSRNGQKAGVHPADRYELPA
jgi:PD-(D/E)XK endonuclease